MPSKTVKEILSTRFPKDVLCTSFIFFQAFPIFCRNSSGHLYFYQFIDAAQLLAALTENMSPILFLGTIKRQQEQSDCPMSRQLTTDSAASWLFPLSPVGVSASSAISEEDGGKDASYHLTIYKSTYLWYTVCVRKH